MKKLILSILIAPIVSMATMKKPTAESPSVGASLILKSVCDLDKKYRVDLVEENQVVLKEHPWFPSWEIELVKESGNIYVGQNGYVFSQFSFWREGSYALTSGEFTPYGEYGESEHVFLNEKNCL